MVVVSARRVASADWDLDHRSATEFAAANDERLIEQASLSQVRDQRGNRAVDLIAELAMLPREVAVRVPRLHVAVIALNHSHAAFDQSPRDE